MKRCRWRISTNRGRLPLYSYLVVLHKQLPEAILVTSTVTIIDHSWRDCFREGYSAMESQRVDEAEMSSLETKRKTWPSPVRTSTTQRSCRLPMTPWCSRGRISYRLASLVMTIQKHAGRRKPIEWVRILALDLFQVVASLGRAIHLSLCLH